MSANTLLTSVVTGGTNSHTTTAEEANALATDFVSNGVVGSITLNSGSGGTGSFCVNADASPDMGVTIKSGQAYVTATPSSQNSQVLRVRAASDYTTYVINSNSSGSTKYDWIYLTISATNANTPSADGSNVASFTTSRSTSNSTDNGSPPTYGLLLAIVTVANAASSITNSNITDKRYNTSNGAQAGSLIVQQNGTGTNAIVQAAGIDANVSLALTPKGSGRVILNGAGVPTSAAVDTSQSRSNTAYGDLGTVGPTAAVTIGSSGIALVVITSNLSSDTTADYVKVGFTISGANTLAADDSRALIARNSTGAQDSSITWSYLATGLTAGSTTFTLKYANSGGVGTATFKNRKLAVIPL